ncbi:MAG: TonB family protein [Terriglobales bacterium]
MSRPDFRTPDVRSEDRPDDAHPDATVTLEQHLLAGFPPDLALDLVLNELVVRAAEATHASAAALALIRGDEMVCRAATGHLAPDLGVPINTHDGLSGACLETRQPQLSVDTEFDPRVDPIISRRLGIRSILIVPVFDGSNKNAQFTGILEVFSSSPAAFSNNDQKLLEDFADECVRIRQAAIELSQRKPAAVPKDLSANDVPPHDLVPTDPASGDLTAKDVVKDVVPPEPGSFELLSPLLSPKDTLPEVATVVPLRRPKYESWALVLGALTILATITVSFMIGYRIGWLRPAPRLQTSPIQAGAEPQSPETTAPQQTNPPSSERALGKRASQRRASEKSSVNTSKRKSPTETSSEDELVVYEKGKVIFRMEKPAPSATPSAVSQSNPPATIPDTTKPESDAIVEASSTTRIDAAPAGPVRLSPAQAESRLLSRTEPHYPPEALAAHRAGSVVLEVHVAEDGTVSSVRTLTGDPILAAAAAEAVRNWRYQPYRQHDRPTQFETDVTLSFSLPN